MSLFLGHIHTWLFGKILLMEEIEKKIAAAYTDVQITEYNNALQTTFGGYLPDEPLENLIDPGNIHGWLQAKITTIEQRQAALVGFILKNDPASAVAIEGIYREAGRASAANLEEKPADAFAIFNLLNDFLLEGMPCDRVNSVEAKGTDRVIWNITQCVHKMNWEMGGTPVEYYYGFRSAFIEGFVEGLQNDFAYAPIEGTEQKHSIYNKKIA